MATASTALDGMVFRTALLDEVLTFWERSVDREFGGYLVDLDRNGEIVGRGDKHIITTSRQLYSFSLGYRVGGRAAHLDAARQGFEFLRQRFYDERNGGWFRTTTRAGRANGGARIPTVLSSRYTHWPSITRPARTKRPFAWPRKPMTCTTAMLGITNTAASSSTWPRIGR